MEKLIVELTDWLQQQLVKNEKNGYIIGVSGGIDSTVLFMLLNKSNLNFTPIQIDDGFKRNQTEINCLNYLSIKFPNKIVQIDTTSIYQSFINILANDNMTPLQINSLASNIRARIRESIFYCYAKLNNYLVIGSVNKLEFYLGYFVKNSSIGDLLPLADLDKTTIRNIAIQFDIPLDIANSKSSGCSHSEFAEDEWQIKEKEVENLLIGIDIESSYKKDLFRKYFYESNHKRHFPPIFKTNLTSHGK